MKAEEFVIWLRGFIAGTNSYNLTPKGWDELKSVLDGVELDVSKIQRFTRKYPNDTDLGKQIRKIYS